jgi:hypothetical protein
MILATGWLLMYSFVAPLNPEYNYKGSMTFTTVEQCVERGKYVWYQRNHGNIPTWVDGQLGVVCRNRMNTYDFRVIVCDDAGLCNVTA